MTVTMINANHVIVGTKEGRTLFSYETAIATISRSGQVTLTDAWDYSRTTGKYRNEFLGEGIAETRKKIADCTYTIA